VKSVKSYSRAAFQALWITVALWIASTCVQAQTQSISGTVLDPSAAAIAGAQVQIRNTNTGATINVTADEQGRYTAPQLGIGEYEVQVTAPGFQTAVRRGVPVTVGSQNVVDFTLQVGQAADTITVEGGIVQVDTSTATVGQLVEQTQMRELPLNGRNFTQLMTLAAGVTQLPPSGGSRYGAGPSYSVAGARPEGQAYMLDNTLLNSFWNRTAGSGATGTTLGVDAIAEFQTLTNTYGAQYGGAGAVVNAVSRSGTNDYHGSLYYFMRNSAMDARNFFDGASLPPFRRHQFGASLGAPIKKDKMFYFVNYEGLRQSLTTTDIALVPDLNARQGIVGGVNVGVAPSIASTLALYPLPSPDLPSSGGIGRARQIQKMPAEENYILGRFDYNISDKSNLFVRYFSDRASQLNRTIIPLWNQQARSFAQSATTEYKRIFANNLVGVFRASYVRPGESAYTVGSTPPLSFFPGRQDASLTVTGLTGLGPQATVPFYLIPNRYTLASDIFWTKGSHKIYFGMDVTRVMHFTYAPFQIGSAWNFQSLTDFLQARPNVVTGVAPGREDAARDLRELYLMPYINDEWQVNSRLTINMGVRYTYVDDVTERRNMFYVLENIPAGNAFGAQNGFVRAKHPFLNNPNRFNIDPRVGIAWDPFGDHKTSIRAGFGIFHNPVQPRSYISGFWQGYPSVSAQENFPVWGQPFQNLAQVPIALQQGADYRMAQSPYMMQWNLNVQRQLPQNTVLTVGYVASRGVRLMRQRDQNYPVPTFLPNGTPVFGTLVSGRVVPNPRINPTFGEIGIRTPTAWGDSEYHSLQVTFNRRLTNNFQHQVTYVFSKAMDNGSASFGLEGGGASAYIMNPLNGSIDWSRSTFDRTHTLRVSGIYQLPFRGNRFVEGWQLSGIWSASSGAPFTAQVGFDRAGLVNAGAQRPNLVAGANPNPTSNATVHRWFDPTAFSLPAAGQLGNLGRNTLVGPGLTNVDFAIMKDTRIPRISESFNVQFRAEAFNILNRANFDLPNRNVFTSTGAYNPTAGAITNTLVPARQLQMALKVTF
jgi:hypothetical protein